MKFTTVAPAVAAILVAATLTNAAPVSGNAELEARGPVLSKPKKPKQDPERKAKYDTGNPRPETPQGEFRPLTAGKKDDYFGDWQTMTGGVNNPAAGKGKKKRSFTLENLEARGPVLSKPKKPKQDPERKAKYDTGNPRPETPVGEFRPLTAGKKDDYFGDWQTMTGGVNNPAAGKGKKKRSLDFDLEARGFDDYELSARGPVLSTLKKKKKDPEQKAKYDTGNPKPETPQGEFRPLTAGKKDDYFGDWQTMTGGVNNPAAGKGKKKRSFALDLEELEAREFDLSARGPVLSKPKKEKDPERKAKYDTGNPRPETPQGEFRPLTAGKKDDYFGDWQTMTGGVNNPAAGKGKKKRSFSLDLEELETREFDDYELSARGPVLSKLKKPKQDPERKAKYDTGNPRPETPQGEFRPLTAGKKDDYFGDWQTMTGGVDNPAAGKGKKKRSFALDLEDLEAREFDDYELSARGPVLSKPKKQDPERKAKYDTGNPRPETPQGEFRPLTAGKKDDYFGDWQTMTGGVNNPAAGKGKKKRAFEMELDELD